MAKRNLYALAVLLLLGVCLRLACGYVQSTIGTMQNQIAAAYVFTQSGHYQEGHYAFLAISEAARHSTPTLRLLVRRSLLDKANETIATLPFYATPDNTADLAVEVHRAQAQLTQLEESFLATF